MKRAGVNVNKDKEEIRKDKLEFSTYCIFTKEKQDLKETIGIMFKDYIENIESNIK